MKTALRLLYFAALPATFTLAFCTPQSRNFATSSSGGTGGASSSSASVGGSGGATSSSTGTTTSTTSTTSGSTGGCDGGTGGSCACPAGQTMCTSGCSTLSTDTDCGACGHACGTGSTCSTGFCTPVMMCTGFGSTGSLALLGTNAYAAAGQSVLECNLAMTAGMATTFVKSSLLFVTYPTVATDSKNLYLVVRSNFTSPGALTLDQSNGMSSNITAVENYPSGWVTSYVTTLDDRQTSSVFAVLTTGVELLEISQATDAGVPSYTCVSAGSTAPISNAAVGGGKVFAASSSAGTVVGSTLTGTVCSTPENVATGLTMPGALVTDGTTVAFADAKGVYACNASLGCIPASAPAPLVAGQGTVSGIVMDTASPPNLYWIGSSGLVTCSSSPSVCNGTPTVLIPNATPTAALAVDATYVYYVQGNTLYRVAK
jgi:hypothetical protein